MQGPLSRRLPFLLLSLALVLPLGGALVALDRPGKEPDDDSLFKYLTVFTEAFGLVRNAYVEPTDPERLLARALDGAMDALGPFALFVPAEGVKPYLAAVKVGTGHSGVRLGRERGVTFAVRVEEGSPAAAAEVEPGDILAMIGPDSTRDLAHWEVEARLAGPAGTRLETEWIHHGKPRKVTLELGPYPAAAPTLREERGVAVIRLPWLGEAQVAHFETLLASPLVQRQPRRLLLDLRGTDGSDERLAYRVAGLFADGELGRLTARGKVLERFADESPDRFRGELVVLVDRATIGAGELLAEALRERAGARLVGRRTFGYTGREENVALAGGGRLRLATAFYTGPTGEVSDAGLVPDLKVEEESGRFGDKDVPLSELTLRKGLALLLGEEKLPEKQAA
ncbi:MAG: S41 family peptidase [Acidobacteriota bacterium]|nr:S41 family peptidase [Acidobacteriota bacterium]